MLNITSFTSGLKLSLSGGRLWRTERQSWFIPNIGNHGLQELERLLYPHVIVHHHVYYSCLAVQQVLEEHHE